MTGTHYAPGDYNVICDRCGSKVKASQTRKEWNGLRVCSSHWEARHPQDFVRGRADHQAVPDPRTEATDLFLATNQVTADSLGQKGTLDSGEHTTWDGDLVTRWDFSPGETIWD
jgi:hypothetical protein